MSATVRVFWLFRHLLAVMLLPAVVTIVVPHWILQSRAEAVASFPMAPAVRIAGAAFMLAGAGMFAWCLSLFARVGRGTLAPWDPPREFVAVGPFRYVRNPMISGVLTILIGEALFFLSASIGVWAASFLAINQVYFLLLEEPGLEHRFGARYQSYKAAVPRWLPRRHPWQENES